jgi:glycerol-3-phosphate O-acyltransferase
LLLKAGSGRLTQDALENHCQQTAQRMSMLYEMNAPEFFDKALFGNFLELLHSRDVLRTGADGKLVYEDATLESIAADARMVLQEQIRNSILQVVHR